MKKIAEICCLVILAIGVVCARVTLNAESGYEGVVLAISSDITYIEGIDLILNIERIFLEATKALCIATDSRTSFKHVVIMVPNTWEQFSEPPISIDENFYYDSAIFNVVTNKGFGTKDSPKAVQYGGCGVTGRGIYLPSSLLTRTPTTKDVRDLVRQWAHYRYGVFDEHGYENNPVYPNYYVLPGTQQQPVLNSCTNNKLEVEANYTFGGVCDPRTNSSTGLPVDEACQITPKPDSNAGVRSSLMFSTDLENVSLFCGQKAEHLHVGTSPTKQNNLCNRLSVTDVIASSQDFTGRNAAICDKVQNMMTFRRIKEPVLQYAFFFDQSSNMGDKTFYDNIMKQPFKNFVKEIPDNRNTFLVKYEMVISDPMDLEPFNLTDQSQRNQLFSKFPDKIKMDRRSSLLASLETFFKRIRKQTKVLAITSSDALDEMEVRQLDNFLMKTEFCQLHLILLRHSGSNSPLSDVITRYEGSVFEMDTRDDTNIIEQQEIIHGILKKFLARESLFIDMNRQIINADPTMTEHRIPFQLSEDQSNVESLTACLVQIPVEIGKDELRLNVGVTTVSSSSRHENITWIEEPGSVQHYCFRAHGSMIGAGSLSFPVPHISNYPLLVTTTLQIKPKARQEDLLKLSSWVNKVELDANKVFIIYAQLRRGVKPVKGARVIVTITHPNSTQEDKQSLLLTQELYDNGLGDPDIMENDGIYSRYFTGFTQQGGYIVKVSADDNGNKAEELDDSGTKWVASGSFQRVEAAGAYFKVDWDPPVEDLYPPNRILDFRVIDVIGNRSTFTWTAPGEDYDGIRNSTAIPQAFEYEIKYFTEYEDPAVRFDEKGVVVNVWKTHGPPLKPSPLGTVEVLYAQLLENDTTGQLFFALRTKDASDNKSPVSNVVPVYMTHGELQPITTENPAGIGNNTENIVGEEDGGLSSAEIGIIVGSIFGGLGLIILIVFVVIIVRRRRQRKNEDETDTPRRSEHNVPRVFSVTQSGHMNGLRKAPPPPDPPSAPVEIIQSWPADTLLRHYDRVQEAKQTNQPRPLMTVTDLLDSLSDDTSMKRNSIYESYGDLQLNNNGNAARAKQITQV